MSKGKSKASYLKKNKKTVKKSTDIDSAENKRGNAQDKRKNKGVIDGKNNENIVLDTRNNAKIKANKKDKTQKPSLFAHLVEYAERINAKNYVRLHKIVAKYGKTQFEISSKNGVKALVAVSKICRVFDVQSFDKGVRFCVNSKQCGKIIALLDNLCYDYKIIKIGGVVPFALRSVARVGIVAGLCVGVVALSIFANFVTRVSVRYAGNDEPDAALNLRVCDILNEYGVKKGAKISAIRAQELQKALSALDGVAFANVSIDGSHVDIVLKSELPKEEFAQIDGSSVTARKTAVVTRIIVEGGTAAKKYGDVVKPGDVLIDGYVMYGDAKIPAQARGFAYGKVFYKKSVFFADVETVKSYGQVKTETRYGIFGKAPKAPKSPYECCEIETSVSQFGFLVPLKIYKYTFRELIAEQRQNVLDEEGMKRKAFSVLATELEESAKILNVYYEVNKVDGGVAVEVVAEAEESI